MFGLQLQNCIWDKSNVPNQSGSLLLRSFCFCPRLSFYHLDLQSARIYLHFKSNIILPNGAALNRFGSCAMTVVKLLTFSSILWLKSVRTANPTIHDKHEAEQVATIIHWFRQKPSLEFSWCCCDSWRLWKCMCVHWVRGCARGNLNLECTMSHIQRDRIMVLFLICWFGVG